MQSFGEILNMKLPSKMLMTSEEYVSAKTKKKFFFFTFSGNFTDENLRMTCYFQLVNFIGHTQPRIHCISSNI